MSDEPTKGAHVLNAARSTTAPRGTAPRGTAPRVTARRGARAVAALSALALLTACTGQEAPEASAPDGASSSPGTGRPGDDAAGSSASGDAGAGPSGSAPAQAPQGVPDGLEEFYAQDLTWAACEDDAECATLTVPLDYEEPDGQTLDVALLRVPATGEAQGSLLLNPGGPGASGVEYAQLVSGMMDAEVRERYDLIGFDPRGVGGTAPIDCLDDDQLDTFYTTDPTPESQDETDALHEVLRGFAEGCLTNAPELAAHVSTPEVARDMDVLRGALREDALDYLGASYGTLLGATYAQLFPQNVGLMVLDGAVDPLLSDEELSLGQARGFERATRAYVEDCVAQGDCPLGDDVEAGLARIPAFLDELDAAPIPVEGDAVGELTEGWAYYGIVVAMYDQAGWPILSQAFEQAFGGDGTMLMFLANLYASRESSGAYKDNMTEAFVAINCLDSDVAGEAGAGPAGGAGDATTPTGADPEELAAFEEASPTWGRYFAADSPCGYWTVHAQEQLDDYAAKGAAPIVVVGTTRDPATPYEWAESLAGTLESGVLVSFDGDGHTAYGRSNDCVDDAVNAYLLEGTVPQDGLSC